MQGFGLSQLREGASSHSLRSILCALTLLFYNTYVSLILGRNSLGGRGEKLAVDDIMVEGNAVVDHVSCRNRRGEPGGG